MQLAAADSPSTLHNWCFPILKSLCSHLNSDGGTFWIEFVLLQSVEHVVPFEDTNHNLKSDLKELVSWSHVIWGRKLNQRVPSRIAIFCRSDMSRQIPVRFAGSASQPPTDCVVLWKASGGHVLTLAVLTSDGSTALACVSPPRLVRMPPYRWQPAESQTDTVVWGKCWYVEKDKGPLKISAPTPMLQLNKTLLMECYWNSLYLDAQRLWIKAMTNPKLH